MKRIARIAAVLALALGLAGCVPYYAVPVDPMDQPFQAALGALQDAGLTVVAADRATGTLRGTRGTMEGVIEVRMRSDGRVGVEMKSRDPDNRDPDLTNRLLEAYNRRMGR
jgi:hypothetical protein